MKMFNFNQSAGKKFFSAFLILSFGFFNLNLGVTNAYFNDTVNSADNTFSAGILDFQLTNDNLAKIIGPEALGEVLHTSVVIPESGSLPMQYVLTNNILTEDAGLCAKLTVEAKLNGVSKYFGPLSGLLTATTTEFGTWEFNFDLSPLTVASQGNRCQGEAIFRAWRADVSEAVQSGFTDEEKITFAFTARMVVLNEIFARPTALGVAPKDKEYIELYNNGDTAVDVLGWQIGELAGATENLHPIVASGASASQLEPYAGAPTVIAPGGFLVLRFGGAATYLNDSGDTVKLYDASSTLLDGHSYPAVAAGKAVVRFPDGIGFWVDPEPTPGTTNTVSLDDLRLAGFTDEQIAEVLELALLKNVTLLDKLTNPDPVLATTTATTTAIATTTPEIDPAIVPPDTGTTTATSIATTTAETDPGTATSTEDGNVTGTSSPAGAGTDDNLPPGEGSGSEEIDLPPAVIPEGLEVVNAPGDLEPVPPVADPVGEPTSDSEPAPVPDSAPDLPTNAVEPAIN